MKNPDDTHRARLSRDAAATAVTTALQRARQEHGSLPCLDEIEDLIAVIEADWRTCYNALRSVRAVADDVVIGVLPQDGRDGAPEVGTQGVEVDQAAVIHIAR